MRFRLWDVFAQAPLGEGLRFDGTAATWRRLAHKVADAIYSRLTGEGGYFDSRVAYVAESGPKANRRRQIAVMDYDGANPTMLTDGSALVLGPSLAKSARQILFTGYESSRPGVYLMTAGGGGRRAIANTGEISLAGGFSPNEAQALISVSPGRRVEHPPRRPRLGLGAAADPDLGHRHLAELRAGRRPDRVRERPGRHAAALRDGRGRRRGPADQLRRRALRHAAVVAARRSHRLHQDRRRPVPHRHDAARRLGREAADRELPRRGADLGPERPGADVLSRDARARRAARRFIRWTSPGATCDGFRRRASPRRPRGRGCWRERPGEKEERHDGIEVGSGGGGGAGARRLRAGADRHGRELQRRRRSRRRGRARRRRPRGGVASRAARCRAARSRTRCCSRSTRPR